MEDMVKHLCKSISSGKTGSDGLELVGGNEKSGNLLLHGRPVCDDGWDLPAADVACRMLGFEGAEEKTTNSHFGIVEDDFLMDDFKCGGRRQVSGTAALIARIYSVISMRGRGLYVSR